MTELALILVDIRSTYNVGSIMRSADCFGVSQLFFVGYTPYPQSRHDTRLPYIAAKLNRAIHKTALGAENKLPFSVYKTIDQAIRAARQQGYTVAAVEQAPNSQPLHQYLPPPKLALILGNETDGITRRTLQACSVILEIPMLGSKESLNVSVCAAIALYALRFGSPWS